MPQPQSEGVRATGDTPVPAQDPVERDADSQLVGAVEALHRELEGLRRSARLRAVIEQAKGVLVERYGISLDEAFDRLRELSQEHNVRLVEVAATLVGVNLPDEYGDEVPEPVPPPVVGAGSATSPEWTALRSDPEVRAKTAAAIFHGVSSSVREGDEAARLVRALVEPLGVAGVILYRLAPDGSLRLVGSDGFPGDFVSAWRAIPPSVDVPVGRAAATADPVYVRDGDERAARFPATAAFRPFFEASASVPVVDVDTLLGVLSFVWLGPQEFDEHFRGQLEHLARTSGPVLLRSARRTDPDLAWLGAVLRLMFDPWILTDPVFDADGAVVDFEIVLVAAELPDGDSLLGRRVVEMWPGTVSSGVFEDMVRVERYGGVSDERVVLHGVADLGATGRTTRVRVVRLGPRVVVHWRIENE
jgi:hypothetical protein